MADSSTITPVGGAVVRAVNEATGAVNNVIKGVKPGFDEFTGTVGRIAGDVGNIVHLRNPASPLAPAPAPANKPSAQASAPAAASAQQTTQPAPEEHRTLLQRGVDAGKRVWYAGKAGVEKVEKVAEESAQGGFLGKAKDFISNMFTGDGFSLGGLILGLIMIVAALAMVSSGGGMGFLGAALTGLGTLAVGKQALNGLKESQSDAAKPPAPAAGSPERQPEQAQGQEQTARAQAAASFDSTPGLKDAAVQAVHYAMDKYNTDRKTATALVAGLLANDAQWEKTHTIPNEAAATGGEVKAEKLIARVDAMAVDMGQNLPVLTEIKNAETLDKAVATATSLYFKPAANEAAAKTDAASEVANRIMIAVSASEAPPPRGEVSGPTQANGAVRSSNTPSVPASETRVAAVAH